MKIILLLITTIFCKKKADSPITYVPDLSQMLAEQQKQAENQAETPKVMVEQTQKIQTLTRDGRKFFIPQTIDVDLEQNLPQTIKNGSIILPKLILENEQQKIPIFFDHNFKLFLKKQLESQCASCFELPQKNINKIKCRLCYQQFLKEVQNSNMGIDIENMEKDLLNSNFQQLVSNEFLEEEQNTLENIKVNDTVQAIQKNQEKNQENIQENIAQQQENQQQDEQGKFLKKDLETLEQVQTKIESIVNNLNDMVKKDPKDNLSLQTIKGQVDQISSFLQNFQNTDSFHSLKHKKLLEKSKGIQEKLQRFEKQFTHEITQINSSFSNLIDDFSSDIDEEISLEQPYINDSQECISTSCPMGSIGKKGLTGDQGLPGQDAKTQEDNLPEIKTLIKEKSLSIIQTIQSLFKENAEVSQLFHLFGDFKLFKCKEKHSLAILGCVKQEPYATDLACQSLHCQELLSDFQDCLMEYLSDFDQSQKGKNQEEKIKQQKHINLYIKYVYGLLKQCKQDPHLQKSCDLNEINSKQEVKEYLKNIVKQTLPLTPMNSTDYLSHLEASLDQHIDKEQVE